MPDLDQRLPAHLEVSALIRQVQQAGGFASVLHKGDRDAGTILVVMANRGENQRLYERMPTLDGAREWTCVKTESIDNKPEFTEYVARRANQDRDTWIIELDIANGERFIGL